MKCPYCGHENSGDAIVCEMCEMPLQQLAKRRPRTRPAVPSPAETTQLTHTRQPGEAFYVPSAGCPNCGTPLTNCTPIVKTNIKSSGGGYGFFSGFCGAILLGPLGLLCGIRKHSITSTNQTWWVCKNCGKEFIEKDAAKGIADSVRVSSVLTTGVIAFLWEVIFALGGASDWLRNIFLLAIIGVWLILPDRISLASASCT